MEHQVDMTLSQRVVKLNRYLLTKVMTVYRLRKAFRDHKVKKKKI